MKQKAGTAKFYNSKTNKYGEFSKAFLTDKRWQKATGFSPVKEVEVFDTISFKEYPDETNVRVGNASTEVEVLGSMEWNDGATKEPDGQNHAEVLGELIEEAKADKPKRGRKPKLKTPQ